MLIIESFIFEFTSKHLIKKRIMLECHSVQQIKTEQQQQEEDKY